VLAVLTAVVTTAALVSGGGEQAHAERDAGAEEGADAHVETGEPALTRLDLGGGRVLQVLADTSDPIGVQLHLTFLTEGIGQLPIDAVTLTAASGDHEQEISVSQLEPGHFVASAPLEAGTWTLQVTGTTEGGDPIDASFEVTVP
jgi:hypothetical protein